MQRAADRRALQGPGKAEAAEAAAEHLSAQTQAVAALRQVVVVAA